MIAEAKTMCGKGNRQYLKIGHKKSPQTSEHYTMHIDNQSGLYCFSTANMRIIFENAKEKTLIFE